MSSIGPTKPTEQHFDKGEWGWDGTQWRKLSLLWGYTDRWVEQLYVENAATGTNTLAFTAVPPGYVYTLDLIGGLNNNNACFSEFVVTGDTIPCAFGTYTAMVAGVWRWQFPIGLRLKEDDVASVILYGCTLNDDLYARLWGSMMKVN